MQVHYELLEKSKQQAPITTVKGVAFGQLRTNHMFVVNYYDAKWQDARIIPYSPFSLAPGAIALHYGQTIFEGAKAFRHADSELYVFRFDKNAERLNHSASIICMPPIPEELQMEGLLRLLDVERAWCPNEPESALYIRPFMFGTQDILGVKPSNAYTYCIMLSPCGPYYPGGFSNAVSLLITEKYHRAVAGGTGTAKTGGNYAASLRPGQYAASFGAAQVLYLDASNTYLEEAGAMNHYHVEADGTFVIPEFNDSILRSITSLSILELAKAGRLKARQEKIPLKKFIADVKSGKIIEAGGFGTAAVVSPVGKYIFDDRSELIVGDGGVGVHSRKVYEMYTSMQNGTAPAPEAWLTKIPKFEY